MSSIPLLEHQARTGQLGTRQQGVSIKHGLDILPPPYPTSFENFVGQLKARQMILAAITSALIQTKVRGVKVPMPHVLLASPFPGVGKTAVARLAAYTYGGGFAEVGGVVKDRDAITVIRQLEDGDVLFIDEIHRVVSRGKASGEWLLTMMQDGVIQTPTGVVTCPKLTVIGATTDAQKLPRTMLDRFFLKPVLEAYSSSEAAVIAKGTATRLGFGHPELLPMPQTDGWLAEVAKACDNNPRRISSLLSNLMDYSLANSMANYTEAGYDISPVLDWNGLTADGLTASEQDYLVALVCYGGTASIGTLKAALNESDLTHTEQALIQKGLICITGQGRTLTDLGADRAQELALGQLANAKQKESA